jgi:hypothetical protein
VEEIRAFERFPERKAIYRHHGDRDIGNPMDKRFMHFGIAMSEIPIGDKIAITEIVVIWAKSLARRANA